MEDPGTVEVDVQLGWQRDGQGEGVYVPDFEVDVGLLDDLELDVDSAFSLQGRPPSSPTLDILWTSFKVGLYDWEDTDRGLAFAIGVQIGPRFSIHGDVDGPGAGGLILVGGVIKRLHFAVSGGIAHDAAVPGLPRSTAILGGLDASLDLDAKGRFDLTGQLFVGHHLTGEPTDYGGTFGAEYNPTRWLTVSVSGMIGEVNGGFACGAFVGVSPKFRLWK